MLQGLSTDPNTPGVEKLVVTSVNDQWLQEPRVYLSTSDLGVEGNLMPPESIFMVKGWNRGVCAILCMLAAFEMHPLREAG